MINSLIEKVGVLEFPEFAVSHLYMHPVEINRPIALPLGFKTFNTIIKQMFSYLPISNGKAFVTIDMKQIKQGETHRRGGTHVDGNYIFDWGGGRGGGWLTGINGRILSPENHRLQYCNPNGGMLIASSYEACRAWKGKYKGFPKQGGNCSHLKLNNTDSFILDSNSIYLANSTCIHESLPLENEVNRTLVRITLPPVKIL